MDIDFLQKNEEKEKEKKNKKKGGEKLPPPMEATARPWESYCRGVESYSSSSYEWIEYKSD